jgi:uncharacterized protein (TIGR00725 family)
MKDRPLIIAVIGGGEVPPAIADIAEEVGREIARQGATLVCGGLGGVMEAACRGANSEGGLTIGILPGENPNTANPYVKIPIATGIGYARNAAVVKTARAVIAIDGSYGTLTEIGYALQSGIPVIGLGTWSIASNGEEDKHIIRADNPREAVEKAMKLARYNGSSTN